MILSAVTVRGKEIGQIWTTDSAMSNLNSWDLPRITTTSGMFLRPPSSVDFPAWHLDASSPSPVVPSRAINVRSKTGLTTTACPQTKIGVCRIFLLGIIGAYMVRIVLFASIENEYIF